MPAAALEWATALTATALPEAQPYPRLYAALDGVLDAIEAAPAARGWAAALVRYELLLLAELGFGLDLDRCVVDRQRATISPSSARRAAARSAARRGAGMSDELLALPAFLREGGAADWPRYPRRAARSPGISSRATC